MARPRWLRPARWAIFLALLSALAAAACVPGLPHRRTVVLIASSAFIGWGTNWLAIWFLFHRFLGLPGTGVIPRNKHAFFRAMAKRTRELLDQSRLVEAVQAKVDGYLRGPEWRDFMEGRVERVLDELVASVRGLPSMVARDERLSADIRKIVYDAVEDFGKADRHVASRQELRRAVVTKIEAVLPEVLMQLRARVRREVRENLEGMGTIRRLLVDMTGASEKMAAAPQALSEHIEALVIEYIRDDEAMDEAVRRAIEGTARSLRENGELDPILERGLAAGSEALAAGLAGGRLREDARSEILRRLETEEARAAITSTFAARVREFLDDDLESRMTEVLSATSDRDIEEQFREVNDTYFLWIEMWGGVLGAVGGGVASLLV